jgi:hypothetical protein
LLDLRTRTGPVNPDDAQAALLDDAAQVLADEALRARDDDPVAHTLAPLIASSERRF